MKKGTKFFIAWVLFIWVSSAIIAIFPPFIVPVLANGFIFAIYTASQFDMPT